MATGWFQNRLGRKAVTGTQIKLVTETGNGFFAWNGKLYESDIIRACIRPKVRAMGKMVAKHIREGTGTDGTKELQVNPEPYMRFLLEEPNPYMTVQMLLEKLGNQLSLNNNAFALIVRGPDGYPAQIYPLPATFVEAVYDSNQILYLRFTLRNGRRYTFPYADIIHLRQDFFENDIFGQSPMPALQQLMEIVNTTDQGIIHAIKNSALIRWLLKFNQSMRPEDIKANVKAFVDGYLKVDTDTVGVAGVDAKADVIRVEPRDYVPNAAQMDKTTQRIMSFFGTNEKIIQSRYTEDEWIAYYEAEVEPWAVQFSGEFTRKLFTRRERGFGNRIYFECSNLQYASMRTKLALMSMVDRGAMLPNEWRTTLNLAPIPGGDRPIRRLDTQVLDEKGEVIDEENPDQGRDHTE